MNKFVKKYWKVISSIGMFCAVFFVNSACVFRGYQPELPEAANKLRKF